MLKQRYITARQYRERGDSTGSGCTPATTLQRSGSRTSSNYVQQELIQRTGSTRCAPAGSRCTRRSTPPAGRRRRERSTPARSATPNGGPASALASVDPYTGEIVALASSQHYSGDSQFNFAAQAHRQPGSSFKPFVLTTAIKQGVDPQLDVLRRQLAEDARRCRAAAPGRSTTPSPASGTMSLDGRDGGLGQRRVRPARARRRRQKFADTARAMEITAHRNRRRSNRCTRRRRRSAGCSEGVTPLEDGQRLRDARRRRRPPRSDRDRQVVFPDGQVETGTDAGHRVLTEGEAYDVTRILEGVITKGTGAGYTSIGCRAEAGKTGTTDGLSDAWFVGYTPLYSTAVWTGHPLSRS